MLDTFRQLIINQYEASLRTLGLCVDRCPDTDWDILIGKRPLSQVVFHTLFFADYYLGSDAGSLRDQPFHLENSDWFADYEQLQDREPASVYDRESLTKYLAHCRRKALTVLAAESEDDLNGESGFPRRNFSRAELHVYNIRHIQHHAAQIVLRLRLDVNVDIPWVGSGWTHP